MSRSVHFMYSWSKVFPLNPMERTKRLDSKLTFVILCYLFTSAEIDQQIFAPKWVKECHLQKFGTLHPKIQHLQFAQSFSQLIPGPEGVVSFRELRETSCREQPPSDTFADQGPAIEGVLQQGTPLGAQRDLFTCTRSSIWASIWSFMVIYWSFIYMVIQNLYGHQYGHPYGHLYGHLVFIWSSIWSFIRSSSHLQQVHFIHFFHDCPYRKVYEAATNTWEATRNMGKKYLKGKLPPVC